MAQYYDVHPESPQPHTFSQMVRILEEGGLIVYPTGSCYALGCALGNGSGTERVRRARQLGDRHHFALVISEFSQPGAFVEMDSWVFHTVKAVTPGSYTFILKAAREVPRMIQHPEKHTIGVRTPDRRTTLVLLDAIDSSLVGSTLLFPDHPESLVEGQTIRELLDHELDAVLDSSDCGLIPTTIVGLSGDEPKVVRVGAGDPGPFE